MLLGNPYKFLSEAATQDLLDPATSKEVKDTVNELEDTLTNNIEEVKPSDMVTNGGVPVTTAESAILVESANEYFVSMEAVIAICEDEAAEETGEAEPDPEVVADKAVDVIDQIATANGVDPDQVTVVISADEAAYLCECAINESKSSSGKKKGSKKAARKVKVLAKVADALKGKLKVFKKK